MSLSSRSAQGRVALMAASRSRRLLSRYWLPALAIGVGVVAGFAINAFHGIFGSQDTTKSSGSKFVIAQFNPKNIKYEIFGDFGGWGRATYWNVESKPVDVRCTALPWSHVE